MQSKKKVVSSQKKAAAVITALERQYGVPEWRPTLPLVDELINTILSQATSDQNRDKGFQGLKSTFSSWEEVMAAPEAAVRDAIYSAGLANQKAARIQQTLRRIQAERGQIELDFLAALPLADAKAWLTSLPGIGPKTAAIVLLFALGRPAFPVDTHVHRVTRCLGLIPTGMSAARAHDVLEDLVPEPQFYSFHMNLIAHGRAICRARRPLCDACPLRPHCDDFQARIGASG